MVRDADELVGSAVSIGVRLVKIGRPRIAAQVSMLPSCTVPSDLHDALIREALYRDVSVAEVVRDALVSHLKTSPMQGTSAQ